MRKKEREKLIEAIASLTANVSYLKQEIEELRAGIEVMMDMLDENDLLFSEEQIQKENDFREGLANIMTFGVKAE